MSLEAFGNIRVIIRLTAQMRFMRTSIIEIENHFVQVLCMLILDDGDVLWIRLHPKVNLQCCASCKKFPINTMGMVPKAQVSVRAHFSISTDFFHAISDGGLSDSLLISFFRGLDDQPFQKIV